MTPSRSRAFAGLAALLFWVAVPAAADAASNDRRMILRYRIVYDRIDPPRPDGRTRWSENTATRLTLTGDGRVAVEGITGSTPGAAATVFRRDGDVVDAGSYRVSYRLRPGRIEIHADFADFTIDRVVDHSDRDCRLSVLYRRRPDHATIVMPGPGPDGIRTAGEIRAVEASCRVADEPGEEPEVLDAGCHMTFDEPNRRFLMRVSTGATCGSRHMGRKFENRRLTLVEQPRHGHVRITPDLFVQYRPDDGWIGPDRFVVEISGERDGAHVTAGRPVEVEVVR